jgi:hypothetical protein
MAVILVGLAALACHAPTAPEPVGTWGGQEASLVLSGSGGTMSYACGSSTVDSAWTIGAGGTFSATGLYYFGGGPVPPGGAVPHPARYAGLILDDSFTISITLTDLNETLGPFHMVRDGPLVVQRCV